MPDAQTIKNFQVGIDIVMRGMREASAQVSNVEPIAKSLTEGFGRLAKTIEDTGEKAREQQENWKKLAETLHIVRAGVLAFSGAVAGVAVAIEESVRRTTRNLEGLFFASQRTGVAIQELKAFNFAVSQIGLGAEQMDAALAGFEARLRNSSGFRAQVEQFVPGFRNAKDVIDRMADAYHRVLQMGDSNEAHVLEEHLRSVFRVLGLDSEMMRALAQNTEDRTEQERKYLELIKRFGFEGPNALAKYAESAKQTAQAWRLFYAEIELVWERLTVELLPAAQTLLHAFSEEILGSSGDIDKLARSLGEWVRELIGENGENAKRWVHDIGENLKQLTSGLGGVDWKVIARDIQGVAEATVWLTKMLRALVDEFGVVPTAIAVMLAAVAAKVAAAGIAQAIIASVFAPVTAAAATSGAAAGAAYAGGILAAMAGLSLAGVGAILGEEIKKNPDKYPHMQGLPDDYKPGEPIGPALRRGAEQQSERLRQQNGGKAAPGDAGYAPIPPAPVPWDGVQITPPPGTRTSPLHPPDTVAPQSGTGVQGIARRSSYSPGGAAETGGESTNDYLDLLLRGFTSWWSGAGGFRPLVSITDEFYERLREVLSELFGINMRGGGGAVAGGGVAVSGGRPAVGPFRGMAGGGTGRVGGRFVAKPGGGGVAGVPDISGMTDQERNFLGLVLQHESVGGHNVMNYVGKGQGIDPTTDKGYTAQGYYQILNSTWRPIAARLGIAARNAMAASFEDQTKVALQLYRQNHGTDWINFNPVLAAAVSRGDKSTLANRLPADQALGLGGAASPASGEEHPIIKGMRRLADVKSGEHYVPPGGPVNSQGVPYSQDLKTMSASEAEHNRLAYAMLKAGKFWGASAADRHRDVIMPTGRPPGADHRPAAARDISYGEGGAVAHAVGQELGRDRMTINVSGAADPHGTARAVRDLWSKEQPTQLRHARVPIH